MASREQQCGVIIPVTYFIIYGSKLRDFSESSQSSFMEERAESVEGGHVSSLPRVPGGGRVPSLPRVPGFSCSRPARAGASGPQAGRYRHAVSSIVLVVCVMVPLGAGRAVGCHRHTVTRVLHPQASLGDHCPAGLLRSA